VDHNGIKWIGSRYGLTKFDGTNWQYFHSENSALLSDRINALLVDINNNLWAGTGNGLSKFDGEVWTVYSGEDFNLPEWYSVRDLTQDKWGNIWALYGSQSKKGLLIQFNGETWHTYDIPPPQHGGDYWYNYWEIDADNNCSIWVAVQRHNADGGALMRFNGADWDIYQKHNSGLKDNNIFSVELDDEDNVWVGTWSGIAKFDGNTWLNFDEENTKLDMWRINTILIDKDNVCWFGTGELGLISFKEHTWTVYYLRTVPPLLYGHIAFMHDKLGNVWFLSNSSLVKYDGNEWTTFYLPNTLEAPWTSDLVLDDDNQIWLTLVEPPLTYKLARFDGSHWYVFPFSFGFPAIICLGNYAIWIASEWDLSEYNFLTDSLKKHLNFEFEHLSSMAFDGKNIWIGTRNDGLVKYDGEQYTLFDTSNSMVSSDYISDLDLGEDTTLWIATDNGLNSFNGQNWQVHEEINNVLAAQSGYPRLEEIELDKEGNIWITTHDLYDGSSNKLINLGGLYKYNGQQWNYYNVYNSGLSSHRIGEFAIDEAGNLWLSGGNGFDIYKEGGIIGNFQLYREEPYTIEASHIPEEQISYHIYPNPFNQYTKIRFDLKRPSQVKITVYDILGRMVDNLLDTFRPAGSHTTVFDGTGNASGVYILKIGIDGKYSLNKMVLVK
jgi:ligand-binding sensor domain-containing protein